MANSGRFGLSGAFTLNQDVRNSTALKVGDLPHRYRWVSAIEVVFGTFLVVGHNIFKIVPNEVFPLFALFCISFKLRDGGWGIAGLAQPRSWGRTVSIAVVAAIVLQTGSELVIQPLAHWLFHAPERVSSLLHAGMNGRQALTNVAIVWTFAAFGEELGPRVPADARGRYWKSLERRLFRRDAVRCSAVRIRALLQRSIRRAR